jgi:hypothetical protein
VSSSTLSTALPPTKTRPQLYLEALYLTVHSTQPAEPR